jgi:hypothetical protein
MHSSVTDLYSEHIAAHQVTIKDKKVVDWFVLFAYGFDYFLCNDTADYGIGRAKFAKQFTLDGKKRIKKKIEYKFYVNFKLTLKNIHRSMFLGLS